MVVARGGKVEQHLQQAVDIGCCEQVLAAYDICDALISIVKGDGKMIGRGHVFARQNDVPEPLGGDRASCVIARGWRGEVLRARFLERYRATVLFFSQGFGFRHIEDD